MFVSVCPQTVEKNKTTSNQLTKNVPAECTCLLSLSTVLALNAEKSSTRSTLKRKQTKLLLIVISDSY